MNTTDTKLTATTAREYAKKIAEKCSDCFKKEKIIAKKGFGSWIIEIDGGSQACYGRTISYVESAEDTLRIFAND